LGAPAAVSKRMVMLLFEDYSKNMLLLEKPPRLSQTVLNMFGNTNNKLPKKSPSKSRRFTSETSFNNSRSSEGAQRRERGFYSSGAQRRERGSPTDFYPKDKFTQPQNRSTRYFK
jgi:hypothetical protein